MKSHSGHETDTMDRLLAQCLKNWATAASPPVDGRQRLLLAAKRLRVSLVNISANWQSHRPGNPSHHVTLSNIGSRYSLLHWLEDITQPLNPLHYDVEALFAQAMLRSLEANMAGLRLVC